MTRFTKVLVANRGEIAIRIIRALKSLSIESVAAYSDPDAGSLFVREADSAYSLSGSYPADTYLNREKIIDLAIKTKSEAIHPGYGFLSENSEFARSCRNNSIKFIGPKAETLEISGNKLECKKLVELKGVPVIPYSSKKIESKEEAAKVASEIGFPVILKSSFGGGGRGIREAKSKDEVRTNFEYSEREARASFGRFSMFIEKKLVRPRHIEVQILANDSGAEVIHLGERECSIQRRYQKLVEQSPSPVVDEDTRKLVTDYAINAAQAVGYSNAGTVEFLRDSQTGNFYFMEINSRLQVEHPVTEAVTGIDIVESQILVASDEGLPLKQEEMKLNGTAIECRINAENPLTEFSPVSGQIHGFQLPGGPGVRVDTAMFPGMQVAPFYDSLIAKLICWGSNFDEARRRTSAALDEFVVDGIETTIPFHREVMSDESFKNGNLSTSFIEERGIVQRIARHEASEDKDEEFFIAAYLMERKRGRGASPLPTPPPRVLPGHSGKLEGRFVDGL
jgi:acetyl-CoA/propionyl-CoA carboxylase